MSPVIVAKVPPQAKTCFIVIPYRPEFDGLSDLIKTAAHHQVVKLDGLCANDLAKGDAFPQVVFDEIRSADLVVAVCSADPTTGQLNGNVLYELGLAASLRKPTLILTTDEDKEKLPSDVSHIAYMTYAWNELKDRKAFVGRLAIEMTQVLGAAKSRLTDLRFPDTSSSEEPANMPAIWRGLKRIVESTQKAQATLVQAQRSMERFCKSAYILWGDPEKDINFSKNMNDFIMEWNHYRANHVNNLEEHVTEVVNTYNAFFVEFPKLRDRGAQASPPVGMQNGFKVDEFFRAAEHEVEELKNVHKRLDKELKDLPGGPSKDKVGLAFNDSTQILPALEMLTNDLYRLLWNVLGAAAQSVEAGFARKPAA